MSWYNVFQTQEAVVTSTTTNALLLASDPVLVYSANQVHASQATVGTISCLVPVTQVTTASSGTLISPYGTTRIVYAGTTNPTTFAWQIADPPSPGICKTLFLSSTTSSGTYVNVQTATIVSSGSAAGVSINMGIAATALTGGVYCQLESLSTSVWAVVGRATAGVATT